MALAAITSVFYTIKDLLDSPRTSVTSFTREILLFAFGQVWLEETLSLSWCGEVVRASNEEIIIIEESHSLQDAIESALSAQLLEQSKSCNSILSLNLDHLKPDIDNFAGMAEKMKGRIEELWEQKVEEKVIQQHIMEICGLQKEDEEEDVSASSATTEMVGFDDEFHRLREILGYSLWNVRLDFYHTVLCITGMAGVGKTELVKRFYNDPMVRANFRSSRSPVPFSYPTSCPHSQQ